MSSRNINLFFCVLTTILFNQLKSSITFGSKYSTVKICSGAACIIENPIYIKEGVVNLERYGIIAGAPIIFDNGTIIDNGNKAKLTGAVNPNDISIILNGNATFYGRNGICEQAIYASSKNNIIGGNVTLYNDITLQDSNTSLSVDLISNLNANIYLNGGSVYLMENNLKFNDEKQIVGPGKVCESGSKLIFGAGVLTFSENLYFVDAEDIEFGANTVLEGTWTFSGNATILGNSNLLSLKNGRIIVERGSSLTIKNMSIHDIQDGNLFCMDNNSTITFENVSMFLSDDYTFSTGKFVISDQVTVLGNGKFIYQSPEESIIMSRSMLALDQGITFSYDPGCMRKDLIVFEDASSTLVLYGATLHTTLTGMHLTHGTLVVNRNSYLSAEKTDLVDEGFTFGNDSADEDLCCEIMRGSKLEIISGSLKYRNIDSTSWFMENNLSSLDINAGCNLYLYQNLNLGLGTLNYKGRGGLFQASGKKLDGAFNVIGYLDYRNI